jgi:hypothetical protein
MPPVLKDERGTAFAAAADKALDLEPWLACPLHVETSPDEVLWSLARQFDVAGPLMQAMRTREQKLRLILSSIKLQQKRGTPWSVEEAMRLIGYTDAKVLDCVSLLNYDGSAEHDGEHVFNAGMNEWNGMRIISLKYDGEAIHDGAYYFDKLVETWNWEWNWYKIRLSIDADSRSLTEADKAAAAVLAADWAPLRSFLAGWEARLTAATCVDDPVKSAERIAQVILYSKERSSMIVENTWWQPLKSGAMALRWRIMPNKMALRNIASAALMLRNGRVFERREFPLVDTARNVVCEGAWTFNFGGSDG